MQHWIHCFVKVTSLWSHILWNNTGAYGGGVTGGQAPLWFSKKYEQWDYGHLPFFFFFSPLLACKRGQACISIPLPHRWKMGGRFWGRKKNCRGPPPPPPPPPPVTLSGLALNNSLHPSLQHPCWKKSCTCQWNNIHLILITTNWLQHIITLNLLTVKLQNALEIDLNGSKLSLLSNSKFWLHTARNKVLRAEIWHTCFSI